MPKTKDVKQARQERTLLQSESRWLQKALFALSKAQDAREKLGKARGKKVEPMTVSIGGEPFGVDTVRESVQERIEFLQATLKETRTSVL